VVAELGGGLGMPLQELVEDLGRQCRERIVLHDPRP
jgi:hypothetical protein